MINNNSNIGNSETQDMNIHHKTKNNYFAKIS